MDIHSFLINIMNNALSTRHYALSTVFEELRFSCAIFSPQSKILQSTISAPVPRLTARLAGRSKTLDTKTAPVFQIDLPPHLTYFIKKEKLNHY